MRRPDIDSWDERTWEKVFREDDRRINLYMRDLPFIIDLPAEDEILSEKMNSPADGFPEYGMLGEWGYCDDCGEDFEEFGMSGGSRGLVLEAEIYNGAYSLAVEWAEFSSIHIGAKHREAGVLVLGTYGLLLLRILYIMETDLEYTHLLRAHSKRLFSTVDRLAGQIRALSEKAPELAGLLRRHLDKLEKLREKSADLCSALKKEND